MQFPYENKRNSIEHYIIPTSLINSEIR